MAHTYSSCLVHYVFSTKDRRKALTKEVRERLWPYLGGVARTNGVTALAVGGTDDHVHMLVSLPATVSVSKAVQLIKGGSSKWISETFPLQGAFAWQEGYGAFSIGRSGIEAAIRYIDEQESHHRTKTFEQEYVAFLEKYDIEYDKRYIWG